MAKPTSDVAGAIRAVGDAVRVTMLTVAKLVPSMHADDALALVDRRLAEAEALLRGER